MTCSAWRLVATQLTQALLALSGFAIAASAAQAAEIKAEALSSEQAVIYFAGSIERGDAERFQRAIGPFTGKSMFVMLHSDGGLLSEAIEIGEIIRAKGIGAAVASGSTCDSACALIWLAGTPRGLGQSAQIGFHAAYTLAAGGEASESGVANALVGRYLTLLDLPRSAVLFATTAPPDKLNYLTAYNYEALGISLRVLTDGKSNRSTSTATSGSSSKESTVWRRSGTWTVAVDNTLDRGCFLISRFTNDTTFRVGIDPRAPKSYYAILTNPTWTSLKEGDEHRLSFQFDSEDPWDVPMTTIDLGGDNVLMAPFKDNLFWAEFTRARTLTIKRGGRFVTAISLAGTSRAFDDLVECQKAHGGVRQADPFAR